MDHPSTTESGTESGFGALFWQWVRRPRWSVAAPLLLIAFTGVFAWQIFLSSSEVDQGLIELNAAYREARPIEARITGFSYAPFSSGTAKINEGKLTLAESILSPQTDKPPSPMASYAFGKFLLAKGKFGEAIRQFETALKNGSNNASLHNDLAVALMEEAFPQPADRKSDYFAQSRAHLEQAIKLDRNALEPLFNLALLYHRQGLWGQAEESWQTYLKNDTRSGWAEEAKRYLNETEAKKKQTESPKNS
jgi:tetratricopeptide (TPR) repeat protein